MNQILSLSWYSFLRAQRSRIFFPALTGLTLFSLLGIMASSWGVAEGGRVLIDVTFLGFHLIGTMISIFWGVQAIAESRVNGSLEFEMAAPISRFTWLFSRFLGLAMALLFIAALGWIAWETILWALGFAEGSQSRVVMLSILALGWLVTASVSIFFASFCSREVALFSSASITIAGLISESIAQTVPEKESTITVWFIEGFASVWNLQHFNMNAPENLHLIDAIPWIFTYALSLIGLFLALSSVIFSRKSNLSE